MDSAMADGALTVASACCAVEPTATASLPAATPSQRAPSASQSCGVSMFSRQNGYVRHCVGRASYTLHFLLQSFLGLGFTEVPGVAEDWGCCVSCAPIIIEEHARGTVRIEAQRRPTLHHPQVPLHGTASHAQASVRVRHLASDRPTPSAITSL
jgi:hypothetical protein